MVCGWQAGGLRITGEAWEGLVPQDSPGTEVQEQDLEGRGTAQGSQAGLARASGSNQASPEGAAPRGQAGCLAAAPLLLARPPSAAPAAFGQGSVGYEPWWGFTRGCSQPVCPRRFRSRRPQSRCQVCSGQGWVFCKETEEELTRALCAEMPGNGHAGHLLPGCTRTGPGQEAEAGGRRFSSSSWAAQHQGTGRRPLANTQRPPLSAQASSQGCPGTGCRAGL